LVDPMTRRRFVVGAAALVLGVVVSYLATSTKDVGGGAGGSDSLDTRWDPTGSHPLPNEGVGVAP
jgi:hypothetical protein